MADLGTIINNHQTSKALEALKAYVDKCSNNQTNEKKQLFNESEYIYLVVGICNHVKSHIKPFKIPVPYFFEENLRVCLITKDSRKNIKPIIESNKITEITEIISLKKLSTHFKTYELKRKLSNLYDIFLADRSIIHMLPNLLGKNFYGRKKLPIKVDMKSKNLQNEFKKAIECVYMNFKPNKSFGKSDMDKDKLLHNVLHCIKVVLNKIPGGLKGIQSFHIKTHDSISIPLYIKYEKVDKQ